MRNCSIPQCGDDSNLLSNFGMPAREDVHRTVKLNLGDMPNEREWSKVLTLALQGLSYSDVERTIRQAKRGAIVQSSSP